VDELKVGLAHAPTSLDPADHRDRASETVIRNMFDGLVTRDSRNEVHLELAESITWFDDTTLEILLRKGVTFHDGVELTAEDVVFTFERVVSEDGIEYPQAHTSPRKALIAPLERIEEVDDYRVRMHFSSPWPIAMQLLVHQQIVPKGYIEAVGTQGFIEHPIGTGPFQFISASDDLSEVVMARYADYYGGAPDLPPVGPACVQRVRFIAIPDATTRAAALVVGEADIIQAVPFDLVDSLQSRDGLQVLTAPGTRPVWLELNMDHTFFRDPRTRKALNYAVDKERIIQDVYGGSAVPLAGPLSPFNAFVDEKLRPYRYDPVQARMLLNRAGWRDTDDDGVLDKNIRPFAFVIDTLPEWESLADALKEDLGEIGISVAVRVWERGSITPLLLEGERTAYLGGWGDSAFDPVGHFEAKWHTYEPGSVYGRGNYSGYSNQEVDNLIRRGELTADQLERRSIYDRAQEIIYEQAPAVFLVLPEQIEAAGPRVLNWEPASDGRINLHDVCLAE
jgi:peptide/nickel transport system substrate-binding protein